MPKITPTTAGRHPLYSGRRWEMGGRKSDQKVTKFEGYKKTRLCKVFEKTTTYKAYFVPEAGLEPAHL